MYNHNKLDFISYPTPFQELCNLRERLNAKPRLFVKRDDLTEVGLGGNKNRKLDYVMYEARERGADTIVTWGGLQSNHCRQTLAYAVMLGMECHLILNGARQERLQGNMLVYEIYGARVHYEPDGDRCPERCDDLAAELAGKGRKPYVIPIGASTPLGAFGYVGCARELAEQARPYGINSAHLFLATGSAGTQAGLEIGARLYLPGWTVHGVAVSRGAEEQSARVAECANETAAYIGEDITLRPGDITVHDEYYGEGYAIPTRQGIDAIYLLGQTEALILDPVYTAKAMSCMVDLLQRGMYGDGDALVFLHTGGFPANFYYSGCFGV